MPAHAEGPRGLRVLIVEDEALIAEALRERLTRFGLDVVGVVDAGEPALEIAGRAALDVALMDIRLKGPRDGVEVAAEIRQRMDVPVVFLTAHSDRATLDRAKEAAPYGYILKPFQERDLIVAIELAVHRHALEQRLLERERRYASTLASIGDGVIATDVDGCVTFMNHGAQTLTGWTFEEARGLPLERVFRVAQGIHDRSRTGPIEQPLEERLQGLPFDQTDRFLVSRNNQMIPIDDSAASIVDDRGRVLGGVVALRDIRDRRLAEEARRKAQEEAIQQIAQRAMFETRGLTAQLNRLQKIQAIGRLAGGVAHDFNNLLQVIGGHVDSLLAVAEGEPQTRVQLFSIRRAADRAESLTRQLLAFGRRQVLRPKVLDLNTVIGSLESMLGRVLGEDVRLETRLAEGLRPVEVDPGQIEQVVVNLAMNSRDAMPEIGGTLQIESANFELSAPMTHPTLPVVVAPGSWVRLSVRDTGMGMNPETIARAYEPFFTTKDASRGSGLGLSVVYGIVKQSGGYTWIESAPGQGTTVNIILPAVDAAIEHETVEQIPEPAATTGSGVLLLVEDDEPVRDLLTSFFSEAGYTVLTAADGREALEIFERRADEIRLVITDVVMPHTSGPVFAREVKTRRPDLPILYLSGYDEDRQPSGKIGLDEEYLQKPVSRSVILARVAGLLSRHG